MNIHKLHDQYSLEKHQLIARKIAENPGLIDAAKIRLQQLSDELSPESIAIQEWEIVLRGDIHRICEFIVQDNDHLQELRQSSPFSGMLSSEEISAIRGSVYANMPVDQ
jgi:hypothetical protein